MHLRYIIGLTMNQGSNAVLKAEGLCIREGHEVEKLKSLYCSNCNEEANIKNPKWSAKCGMVVLSFCGYQEALEQKHKDGKINLIEKQVVERDPVAKHSIDLVDLDFILSEIEKDREGKNKPESTGLMPISKMSLVKLPLGLLTFFWFIIHCYYAGMT
jgi:type I site-specific restriction-modification system R (restriction) subunit